MRCGHKWVLVFTRQHPTSNLHHVIPLDDLLPHDMDGVIDCGCQPAVFPVCGEGNVVRSFQVVHNSFDGRPE